MRVFFRCLAFSMALLSTHAWADGAISIGSLDERLHKAAKISGSVVKSVTLRGRDDASAPMLQVYLPKSGGEKTLCLNMISADGLYAAQAEFSISGNQTEQLTELQFETDHRDYLRKKPARNFAVSIRYSSCLQPSQDYLAAVWNQSSAGADLYLEIKINSLGADQVILVNDQDLEIDCTLSTEDHLISFDHVCRVPSSLAAGTTTQNWRVIRLKDGDFMFPEARINLLR